MLILRSEPVSNERRYVAHNISKRIPPATIAARQKATVRGNNNSSAELTPKAWITGWNTGFLNTRSGAVNTPRKGNSAPILRISANEASNIKTSSSPN